VGSPHFKLTHYLTLTLEHKANYVPCSFLRIKGSHMVRRFAEEAMALASLSLFLATVAVWAQVLGVL
jgi:hypothetical protein